MFQFVFYDCAVFFQGTKGEKGEAGRGIGLGSATADNGYGGFYLEGPPGPPGPPGKKVGLL